MSIYGGPDIETNGLIFSVDAANRKSHPGTGTSWKDLSGNGNNGTKINGPSFSSLRRGKVSFDGSNDYVSIPYSSVFNVSNALTIESIVKFANNSSSFIFEKGNVNTQYSLFSHGTDIVFRTFHNGDSGYITTNMSKTSAGIVNGQWHHIVGSWDGSVKRIYVDGVLKKSQSKSGALKTNTQGSAIGRFGGTSSGYFFTGDIAKVAIYNIGLSQSQITQHYNAFKGRFGL